MLCRNFIKAQLLHLQEERLPVLITIDIFSMVWSPIVGFTFVVGRCVLNSDGLGLSLYLAIVVGSWSRLPSQYYQRKLIYNSGDLIVWWSSSALGLSDRRVQSEKRVSGSGCLPSTWCCVYVAVPGCTYTHCSGCFCHCQVFVMRIIWYEWDLIWAKCLERVWYMPLLQSHHLANCFDGRPLGRNGQRTTICTVGWLTWCLLPFWPMMLWLWN